MKQIWIMLANYDSAVPAGAVKIDGDIITLTASEEYNKLMLVQTDNDVILPLCSKDGLEWVICFGATKCGKAVPLMKMREDMRKLLDIEWTSVEDGMPEPSLEADLITLQDLDEDYYYISPDCYTPSGAWISDTPTTPTKVLKWAKRPEWFTSESWRDNVTLSFIAKDPNALLGDIPEFALETHETLAEMYEEKQNETLRNDTTIQGS